MLMAWAPWGPTGVSLSGFRALSRGSLLCAGSLPWIGYPPNTGCNKGAPYLLSTMWILQFKHWDTGGQSILRMSFHRQYLEIYPSKDSYYSTHWRLELRTKLGINDHEREQYPGCVVYKIAFAVFVYTIWRERNNQSMFSPSSMLVGAVMNFMKARIRSWLPHLVAKTEGSHLQHLGQLLADLLKFKNSSM